MANLSRTSLNEAVLGDTVFGCWKGHNAYQKTFDRLLRDLKPELERPAAAGVGE